MCEQSPRRKVAICLLCGLPGAGKSTLARSLSTRTSQQRFATISYDEIITAEAFRPELHDELYEQSREISRSSALLKNPETSPWKQHRQYLLEYLEHLIVALLNSSALAPPHGTSDGTWHRFVGCLQEQGLISSSGSSVETGTHSVKIPENDEVCLVLDDNFYYQSMRYEVYQLARKHSLGFCQIYLHCPVESCLLRNKGRPVSIPEGTIWLMDKKIQKPNPEKNSWEQNSLVLHSAQLIKADDPRIIKLVNQAMANPLRPLQENLEIKDKDRAITAASILHQADQSIRRFISETMRRVKGAVSAQEMKVVAQELQSAKSEFLEDLKKSLSEKGIQPTTERSAATIVSLFKEQTDHIVQPFLTAEQSSCPEPQLD
ncbi:L-seryl-tRNA(Sec) kinase [Xenopus tropicalis]|uniref:L-seryl-tRNA(Sec) kinase n=1 Tax=Xenopus tropicalis TaxID=8364 RepID=B2GUE1_XENTR|nr:L-seryl-tRNA(Sec) kinase [Xenopus tropicalis]AAI66240.1 LOC100158568 protein [Xenopus tropicalis]|eukprot:NP_001121470.1 L-seryl-tRNA(Sec) kinase [Xenopus tropicalis]